MAAPMKLFTFPSFRYFVSKFMKSGFKVPSIKQLHVSTCVLSSAEFDPSILDNVVCPLSKNPLRYDAAASELVNDELGVAYKIIDGIPNLIPQDARMIKQDTDDTDSTNKQSDKSDEKT